jgi:hypothetical protein
MDIILPANLFRFHSHFESSNDGKNNFWLDKQINLKKAKPSKGGIFLV